MSTIPTPIPAPPTASVTRNTFPFYVRPHWLPSPARLRKANAASAVFGALYDAHKTNVLAASDIQDTFFASISDLISYRDGWHCGRYWSVNAWNTARTVNGVSKAGLIAEHVLPRSVALNYALTQDRAQALDFVWEQSFYCMITKDEDQLLRTAGLHALGYPADPWERYAEANRHHAASGQIQILDAEDRNGNKLISSSVRSRLLALGLLASWQPGFGALTHLTPPLVPLSGASVAPSLASVPSPPVGVSGALGSTSP
jgi:hypothetical protein